MSTEQLSQTDRLAAEARSIVACADEVHLTVEGIDDIESATLGPDRAGRPGELGFRDVDGRPVFTVTVDAALAAAAREGRRAVLTLTSALGEPRSADRAASVTISGTLVASGLDTCECCAETRAAVRLEPTAVLLSSIAGDRVRVPVTAFTSEVHALNRGFLQRSAEHANRCHQDELRRAVATTTDTRLGDIVGVHLVGLSPTGVDVQWVDLAGAHSRRLAFSSPARTPDELGERLRHELHAGLC